MKNFQLFTFVITFSFLFIACSSHKKAAGNKGESSKKSTAKNEHYYEAKFGVNLNSSSNIQLYRAVDSWIGVPHKMGACTKNGVDCSCLVNALYKEVYECNPPRDTKGLWEKCKHIGKDDLKEGDIIFFKMKGGKVDHVGLYLNNKKFVHASVKKGVMVSSLSEPHFAKAFRSGGRLKCSGANS